MVAAGVYMLTVVCVMQFFTIIYLVVTLLNDNSKNKEKVQDSQSQDRHEYNSTFSSSVFCTGYRKRDRECRFLNLCYKKAGDEYLFIQGERTHIYGIPGNTKDPLLDLSTVDDHNAKYFFYKNISNLEVNDSHVDIQYIRGRSILFHRFNPENLMHVIHDDVIPLYHAYTKYFLLDSTAVNLVIMDGRLEDEYFYLYQLFSDHIYTKSNLTKSYTCFEDVIVGLPKVTTWYQYGFKVPQGPINMDNYPVMELLYFRKELKSKLGQKQDSRVSVFDEDSKLIVLFSRRETRRILNAGELILKLTSYFKLPVVKVDLDLDDIAVIVNVISKAFIVIGVHGAHLVTCLFMQPSSILIEIFPYAIPPDNYTPYKTLARLLNLNYIAWVNDIEENSITHDDWPAYLGGILSFSPEKQEEIKNTKYVPLHLCCKDPFWLYRIYQDTYIDVNDFIKVIDNEMRNLSLAS